MNDFIAAFAGETSRAVQGALPHVRRPARRRHPVPGRQGAHRRRSFSTPSTALYESGGADRPVSSDRPPKDIHAARGTAAVALRVGPDHGHPAARSRDPHRDPPQEGGPRRHPRRRTATSWPRSPQRIQTNIRELEGAFTRVVAFASLNGVPVTVDLVRDVLHDQFPEGARPGHGRGDPEGRRRRTSTSTVADLRGDRRTQQVVYPRQLAMYLCRELTDLSLPEDRREVRRPRPHDRPLRRVARSPG